MILIFAKVFQIYLTVYLSLFIENNEASFKKDNDEKWMLLKAKSHEAEEIPKYFLIYKNNELSPLIELEAKDYRIGTPENLQGICILNQLYSNINCYKNNFKL